jgi:hypothetical protein
MSIFFKKTPVCLCVRALIALPKPYQCARSDRMRTAKPTRKKANSGLFGVNIALENSKKACHREPEFRRTGTRIRTQTKGFGDLYTTFILCPCL